MNWQPIETAPKDGSFIDIWVTGPDEKGWRETDFYWNGRNFVTDFEGMHILPGSAIYIPTHWMPLPPPPASDSDVDAG